jgi:hypothetical protein
MPDPFDDFLHLCFGMLLENSFPKVHAPKIMKSACSLSVGSREDSISSNILSR